MNIESYRSAEIPHLRATVYFMDLSKLKGIPHKGSAYTCVIGETDDMHIDIGIFISNIKKAVNSISYMPAIFHEITHAIQILCEQRNMTIETESEHTAMLASYMAEKLLDLYPSRDTTKTISNENKV